MAAPLATGADVEMRLGATRFEDQELLAALLRGASAIARREVPSIDARMTAGTLDADLVVEVVAGMVVRVLRNRVPADDLLSLGEDSQPTEGWDGVLRLTAREKHLLSPQRTNAVGSTYITAGLGYPFTPGCRRW